MENEKHCEECKGDGWSDDLKETNRKQKEENTALNMLKKPVNWDIADSSENVDIYVYGER
jgi:hypothetical protein